MKLKLINTEGTPVPGGDPGIIGIARNTLETATIALTKDQLRQRELMDVLQHIVLQQVPVDELPPFCYAEQVVSAFIDQCLQQASLLLVLLSLLSSYCYLIYYRS